MQENRLPIKNMDYINKKENNEYAKPGKYIIRRHENLHPLNTPKINSSYQQITAIDAPQIPLNIQNEGTSYINIQTHTKKTLTESIPTFSLEKDNVILNSLENQYNVLTSVQASPEYKYWSEDHTKMLIDLYDLFRKKLGTLFEVRSVKKLWEILARQLNEIYNINVSPSNVENRWRVLDRNYKKWVDSQKQTGGGRKHFPYAEQMEKINGKKKNIKPEILLSSSSVDEDVTDTKLDDNSEAINDTEKTTEKVEEKTGTKRILKISRTKGLQNRNSILEAIRRDRKEYHEKQYKINIEKIGIIKEQLKELKRKNDLLAERNALLKNLAISKNSPQGTSIEYDL